MYYFIDRKAREITRLVASVRLCVCVHSPVWHYSVHLIKENHHDTWNTDLCVCVSNQETFAIKSCAQWSGAFNLNEATWCWCEPTCNKLFCAEDMCIIKDPSSVGLINYCLVWIVVKSRTGGQMDTKWYEPTLHMYRCAKNAILTRHARLRPPIKVKKHFARTPKSVPDWKINITGNPLILCGPMSTYPLGMKSGNVIFDNFWSPAEPFLIASLPMVMELTESLNGLGRRSRDGITNTYTHKQILLK